MLFRSLKYCSRGLPTAFFPAVASSWMFTTDSLCLIVCPIHERFVFLRFLKVIFLLSPFETRHHSLFYFIFNILLLLLVSNAFTTFSSFFPRVRVSDPYRATHQIQIYYIIYINIYKHSRRANSSSLSLTGNGV